MKEINLALFIKGRMFLQALVSLASCVVYSDTFTDAETTLVSSDNNQQDCLIETFRTLADEESQWAYEKFLSEDYDSVGEKERKLDQATWFVDHGIEEFETCPPVDVIKTLEECVETLQNYHEALDEITKHSRLSKEDYREIYNGWILVAQQKAILVVDDFERVVSDFQKIYNADEIRENPESFEKAAWQFSEAILRRNVHAKWNFKWEDCYEWEKQMLSSALLIKIVFSIDGNSEILPLVEKWKVSLLESSNIAKKYTSLYIEPHVAEDIARLWLRVANHLLSYD